MHATKKIAVVGAGMAGLSAAYRLQQFGFSTTVYEKNHSVGGRTASLKKDGYVMDLGAITLSPAYRETMQLIDEVGAGDSCTSTQPVLAFARDGALHDIDLSEPLKSAIKTGFLSFGAKLRLLNFLPTVLRFWSRCDFEDMAQLEELDVENCESFALRKAGREVHDYFVDPMIRVNMFSSSKLSSAVDLIWVMKVFGVPTMMQVKGGMGVLPQKVAAELANVQLSTVVEELRVEDQRVAVTIDGATRFFDGAVLAIPTEKALEIAPWISGNQREWFAKAKAIPSLTVHVGLKTRPDSSAAMVMVPSSEAKDVLGIVLEHNKCPDRAPQGKGLIALHMTGEWAESQRGLDRLQVARNALDTIVPFMGDLKDQIEMVNLQEWDHVDHERYVGVYKSLRNAQPEFMDGRVTFAGEYNSAGIEGAVICGRKCAAALARQLR